MAVKACEHFASMTVGSSDVALAIETSFTQEFISMSRPIGGQRITAVYNRASGLHLGTRQSETCVFKGRGGST